MTMSTTCARRAASALGEAMSRLKMVEKVARGFGAADARVGLLEHGEVEPLLAAEIIVDHALAGARALGDGVDPRAAIAFPREFARGDFEDIALGALGVVDPSAPGAGEPRHVLPFLAASTGCWRAALVVHLHATASSGRTGVR